MSSIVFATASITSTDPCQSTDDRTVGLNCTGCTTGVKWNTYRMNVLEETGTTHSPDVDPQDSDCRTWTNHSCITAWHVPRRQDARQL